MPTQPKRRARRSYAIGLIGLATAGIAGVALVRSLLSSPDPAAVTGAPLATPTSSGGAAPADANPSVTEPTVAPRGGLVVTSDLPMVSLSIGGRSRVLATPSREVSVELDPSAAGPVAVEAVAASGERGRAVVEDGATTVEIRFVAAAVAAPAPSPPPKGRPAAGPAGTASSTKGPKLGDYPGKR